MTRHVAYQNWSTAEQFATGSSAGVSIDEDALVLSVPAGTFNYADPFTSGAKRYDYSTWTSPLVRSRFAFTELVASWNADTPLGTWLQVAVRGQPDTGGLSGWYILGRWTADDSDLHRTSVNGQGDALATVSTDTLVAASGHSLSSWQLKVTLFRITGTTVTPRLSLIAAMTSAISTAEQLTSASPAGVAGGVTLDVPTYSQEIHVGKYPHWDGGGEAWCSPTSTAMVLRYWQTGPTRRDFAWVDPAYRDPEVVHAARHVYDYAYGGAGNWPFNTAYAARFGLTAFVTRLRSLTEAEQFIAAGIPLVVSVSFSRDQLTGAGYDTKGHLLVIVGFTDTGDVVVNDPASHLIPDNSEVRTVYHRAQFEDVWARSGGITYVIHPPSVPLPPTAAEPNW